MDSIAVIVNALAAGAATGLKPGAEQVIKDAYAGVKKFIQLKYGTLSLEALEQKPDSEAKQASVAEDLVELGAGDDNELLMQAKSLLDAVKVHDPVAAGKLNINLEEVEAAYFKLKGAAAERDINVGITKSNCDGGINLDALTAGSSKSKK